MSTENCERGQGTVSGRRGAVGAGAAGRGSGVEVPARRTRPDDWGPGCLANILLRASWDRGPSGAGDPCFPDLGRPRCWIKSGRFPLVPISPSPASATWVSIFTISSSRPRTPTTSADYTGETNQATESGKPPDLLLSGEKEVHARGCCPAHLPQRTPGWTNSNAPPLAPE